jgi:uncharacterized protein with FMN-binding domain
MNIKWNIVQCDYRAEDGYIKTAHWVASATDGTYTASSRSTCSFANGSISIEYEKVTEENVLSWCWSNGVDKQAVENILRKRIEAQKSPQVLNGKPWENTLGD